MPGELKAHFEENLYVSGHTACAGCGQSMAVRIVMNAAGKNTIVTNATGCLEVFSTKAPETAFGVPWIHSLFENSAAVASGVEAALKYLGKLEQIRVIAQAGDGGTADIGLQAISGMLERGQDVLFVCYDNEAYMNCLSLDSLIICKEGLKKITEVKIGEEIYAFDQKNHQLVLKKCSGIFDNGIKDVYELQTLHHSIKATSNHPFLVVSRSGRGKTTKLIWKTLAELKLGDEVVTLKKLDKGESFKFSFKKTKLGDYKVSHLNPINIPEKSSPDIMRYLGIYLGDGWTRVNKAEVGFAVPEGSKAREELLSIHSRVFGNSLTSDETYVYVKSINSAKFIDSLGFGQGAKHKKIPAWVFTLPESEKESFVEGLMLSDGYKLGKSWRYVSASQELLKGLRLLLQTIDMRVGKIHLQTKKKGRHCVYRPLLEDSTYGYICFSKKSEWDVKKFPSQYKYQNFLIGNKHFTTEKITSIKLTGKEPTLDLRVEDEHNFVANGIVVHNTGIQRSGLTPFYAQTTTSPVGKFSSGNPRPKKPMVEICAAHHIPYSATASVGTPKDVERKVKKALSIRGPKYLQIHVPCPLGWKSEPSETIEIAKLAVQTGLYPLVEYEYGKLIKVMKLSSPKPVQDYLGTQGRFKHLLKNKEDLAKVQEVADKNIEYYGLSAT